MRMTRRVNRSPIAISRPMRRNLSRARRQQLRRRGSLHRVDFQTPPDEVLQPHTVVRARHQIAVDIGHPAVGAVRPGRDCGRSRSVRVVVVDLSVTAFWLHAHQGVDDACNLPDVAVRQELQWTPWGNREFARLSYATRVYSRNSVETLGWLEPWGPDTLGAVVARVARYWLRSVDDECTAKVSDLAFC